MGNTGNLVGLLTLVLLIAAPLALVISLILRMLYLAAVRRSMSAYPARDLAPAYPPAPLAPLPGTPALSIAELEEPRLMGAAEALARRVRWRRWAVAAAYSLGGLVFAATLACAFLGETGTPLLPGRFVFVTAVFAWPIVLTIGLTAALTWRGWAGAALGYFLLLAAVAAALHGSGLSWAGAALFWLGYAGPGALTAAIFIIRPLRAIGPLILPLTIAAVAGANFAVAALGASPAITGAIGAASVRLHFSASAAFALLQVFGVLLLGAVGWWALGRLGAAYQRRAIGDQTILIDAIWLAFAILEGIELSSHSPLWLLAALGAFAAYKVVTALAFALIRPKANAPAPTLLLLRVFSLGRRSEALFTAFAKAWRHGGPIRLIAGPDLAATTIEPHEFLHFLAGGLSRRFIANANQLNQRLAEAPRGSDPDGRYRVGAVFCCDNAWRMALARLVKEADAVLMDLRGFARTHHGCAYEIGELIQTAPLEKVLFVIDGATDETVLRQAADQARANLSATSPNRTAAAQIRLFRLTGDRDMNALLRHVCAAAG